MKVRVTVELAPLDAEAMGWTLNNRIVNGEPEHANVAQMREHLTVMVTRALSENTMTYLDYRRTRRAIGARVQTRRESTWS